MKKDAAESGASLRHHSHALKEGERELGHFSRGALAGSGALGHLTRAAALASGAFLGGAGLVAVLKSSIEAGSDLEKQLLRTAKVFGAQAGEIKKWSKTSAEAMGLARSEALDAANSIGTLLKNMGVAPQRSAQMSKSITQLASDMAAFKGVKPEVALAALEAGLQGRTRSLKTFGIVLDQTTIKQEAERQGLVKSTVDLGKVRDAELQLAIAQQHLNDAISKHGPRSVEAAQATVALHKAEDALAKARGGHAEAITNEQKALATYSLLMRQTGNQQGTFAQRSKTLAGQMQILHAQTKDLREELGTSLIPVLTKYLPHVTSWIKKNEESGRFQRDFNKAVKLGTEVVQGIIPFVKTAVAVWKGFSGAVGGSKHAIELLTAAFVAYKGVTAALGFKALLTNIGLIGSTATTAEGEVVALRTGLLSLGGAAVLGALAAATASVAAVVASSGSDPNVPSSAGARGKKGIVAGLIKQGKFTTAQAIQAGIEAGLPAGTPVGTALTHPKFVNYLYRVAQSEGILPQAAGGAASEAAAKAAAGKARSGVTWSGDYTGLDAGFKSKVEQCVGAAGGSSIYVTSGRRSREHNAAIGGASNSNHLTGHAADGTCLINGRSYPLGNAPMSYAKYGLRAGSTFNWGGGPDIYHVDDGTNVGGAGTTTATATPATTGFQESPQQKRINVLETAVSRAKALTPKNQQDDLRALKTERDYVKQQITSGHATKDLYDQLISLNDEIDSITTGKKVRSPRGTALLSGPTRVAIAEAKTPTARRSALVQAREELEKLQKTASKAERVPIAEELGRINKQIQAIDVAAHRKKVAAIAKQTQELTARVKAAIEAQKQAWAQHVQDLQQIADDAKTKFEDQWAKIADATLSKFDDATQRGMSKLQKDFAAQLDAFDRETQRGLAALAAPAQTPAEKLLADRAAKRQTDDDVQRVKDAQKALDDARAALGGGTNRDLIGNATTGSSTWTPPLDPNTTPEQAAASMQQLQDAVVQAQKDLDDALYQQQTDDLQTQADAERKAADKKASDDQQAYQDQRDALRAHMEDVEGITETGYANAREKMKGELDGWLEDQKGKLETGKGDWKTFFGELVTLSDKYGLDAGAAWQAAWIQAGGAAGGVAAAAAAAAAAQGAGPALGAAGFGGFDANGNWVGGTIDSNPGFYGFATGGVVGQPRPRTIDPRDTIWVRARAGETIRTPEQEAALQYGSGGDVHVHFHGDVYDTKRAAEDAMAQLAKPGLQRLGPSIYMGR